jgi:hypothetical protein
MFKVWPTVFTSVATVFVAGAMVVNNGTAQSEKATGAASPTTGAQKTEREKRLAAATDAAKELLLMMDTDKSGKVSKQEWMKFMEAEFDRLDADHKGQLDVKELTQSRMRVRPHVGK